MTVNDFEFPPGHPRHGRPHDYFGRKTIGAPLIAADLLRYYTKPVVAEHVDLERYLKLGYFFVPLERIKNCSGTKEPSLRYAPFRLLQNVP